MEETDMISEFERWFYKVCKYNSNKRKWDIHEIAPLINMTEAKLAYAEGISPKEFEL